MIVGALVLAVLCATIGARRAAAQAKPASGRSAAAGRLAGVVRDASGTPQMGASIELIPEAVGVLATRELLSNTQGVFRGEKLPAGFYSVRVTLAGFLPTLEQHVRITPNLTTVLRIELETMYASLDELRRAPISVKAEPDDWKWVLRSAPGLRPALQWQEEGDAAPSAALSAEASTAAQPRLRLEFTDGAMRPGSVSNVASAPGTQVAYEQKIGAVSRLIVAGQMSYENTAAGGFATVWLPSGSLGTGPQSAIVLREAKLSNDLPVFRGLRLEQSGNVPLGDRAVLSYEAEYVMVGLGRATSSLRPRLELDTKIARDWHTQLTFAAQPGEQSPLAADMNAAGGALQAALDELDAFPSLLWREGRPVLQSGWHEELSANRKLGKSGSLQVAAFHDDYRHVAIFVRGNNLPADDFFQDAFSNASAYDGGSSGSWGGRVALRQKLNEDVEIAAVYAMAGALAPVQLPDNELRDSLRTAVRQSIGANVTLRVPRTHTRLVTGYKWISGPAVSRVDAYGESLYQMDPYLRAGIRQELPKFGPGRWEAMADYNNLLAQGYVPLGTVDGKVILLPAVRTFRGGVSVQF
jgi:hypothetical protein